MALLNNRAFMCLEQQAPTGEEGSFLLSPDRQLVSPVFECTHCFFEWLLENGWQPTTMPFMVYRVLH